MYNLREDLLDAVERNIDLALNSDEYDRMYHEKLNKLYELRDKIMTLPDEELDELEIDMDI